MLGDLIASDVGALRIAAVALTVLIAIGRWAWRVRQSYENSSARTLRNLKALHDEVPRTNSIDKPTPPILNAEEFSRRSHGPTHVRYARDTPPEVD